MLIKGGKPYCDECGKELQTLSEDECLEDIMPHGWTKWETAHKHYCYGCSDKIEEEIGYPPCDECETQPCERGRDCWANPPLHIFPYETYYAELKPQDCLRQRVYVLYARNPEITAKEASELLAASPEEAPYFYRHNQNYLNRILSDLRKKKKVTTV